MTLRDLTLADALTVVADMRPMALALLSRIT